MPIEIEAFLTAYHPRFVCIPCLAAMTTRDEGDVRSAMMALLAERRAETRVGECLNCSATSFVVRRRLAQPG